MNLRPSRIGSRLIALVALTAPVLGVLQAFGAALTKDQLAAVTGLAGAAVIFIQTVTGNPPEPDPPPVGG